MTFIHFLAQLSRPGWAEPNWPLSAMVIEGNLWLMLTRSCFTEGTGTTGKAWTVTGSFGGSSSEASLEEMEGPVPSQATRTQPTGVPGWNRGGPWLSTQNRRPWGRGFPLWNARWFCLSVWRVLSGKFWSLLTWLSWRCRHLSSPLCTACWEFWCVGVWVCELCECEVPEEREGLFQSTFCPISNLYLSFFCGKRWEEFLLLICAQQKLPYPIQYSLAGYYRLLKRAPCMSRTPY